MRRSVLASAAILVLGIGATPSRTAVLVAPGPSISLVTPTGRLVGTRTPLIVATVTAGSFPISPSSVQLIWDRAGAVPPDTIHLFSNTDVLSATTGRYAIDTASTRAVMAWQPDSAHGLNPGATSGDSALITVKGCDNTEPGNCRTVTQWVVIPKDSTAILAFNNVPVENLGAGFSAPFGPGVGVSGGEVETGLSTIPYFSMGGARSAGLVYSTRQSYPRVLVPVDVELRWPTGTPTSIQFHLWDGAVRLDSFTVASPTCATGGAKRCRAVLQGDFSGSTFPTPVRKWLKVEVMVTSGGITRSSSSTIEAVLVDRRATMYGSGWWPSGFSKLVAAGDDRLLIGPGGTATIFRGNGDQLYLSPPGSLSTLSRTAGGWELTTRGTKAKAGPATAGHSGFDLKDR